MVPGCSGEGFLPDALFILVSRLPGATGEKCVGMLFHEEPLSPFRSMQGIRVGEKEDIRVDASYFQTLYVCLRGA